MLPSINVEKQSPMSVTHLSTPINHDSNQTTTFSQSCWHTLPDGKFSPSYPTVDRVPNGLYEVQYDSQTGVFLKIQPLNTDELYQLPSPELLDILQDIGHFWERVELYRKYNYVHKRGILMYGEPGCGKSGIIQLLVKQLMELGGIVVNIKNGEDLEMFISFSASFRKIEPNRPLAVLLEDIDAIASEGQYSTSTLLNLLDGVKQIDGVVYIATTNYPEKLQERLTNRPSRFDRRYRIDPPNDEVRRAYLENKLKSDDLAKINLDNWVKKTSGMSLSHLKEIVISVMVMGKTFEETLEILSDFKKKPRVKVQSEIGF